MNENTVLLKEILVMLREIRDSLRSGTAAGATAPSAAVASDSDLEGTYGDPPVRKDPPRWNAANGSYVGCRLSECPIEYLETLAALFDWQAEKDEEQGKTTAAGKPTAPYKRKDAARCRGWIARKRAGWQPPANSASGGSEEPQGPVNDDPLPF